MDEIHSPKRIVHHEVFSSREEAVEREKELKTGFGRKWLKEAIASGRARQAGAGKYEDKPGFCKAATLKEIQAHGHVLTPGRYVGAEEIEDDGVPFEEKMAELSAELYEQMAEAEELDAVIRQKLEVLGYGE